ncbi:response regulator [Sphingomonas montana]|uniref:response regulator n=1 Tax=Sphingomonas montana TaxID=1843236 RepID=UPI00096D5ABC|nr:response regulator [Sphingomonas montana]
MRPDRLHVLHVEDDPDIRLIAGLSLALDDAIVLRSAPSGTAALAMLRGDAWRPDLLLLDMMMPEMDGTGLVTRIRAIDGLACVPVVFLTARAQPGDMELYRVAGSLGLIVKPFDPLTLAARLRAMVTQMA